MKAESEMQETSKWNAYGPNQKAKKYKNKKEKKTKKNKTIITSRTLSHKKQKKLEFTIACSTSRHLKQGYNKERHLLRSTHET